MTWEPHRDRRAAHPDDGSIRRARSCRIRDVIVPGSARTERVVYDHSYITVRCGRCGHEQEAGAELRTAHCKSCRRSMQIERALGDAAADIIDQAEIEAL
jgi:ribosomal protein S27E